MPNFQKTKFYRLPVGEDNYVGHTTQTLAQRRAGHIKAFRREPNRKVFKTIVERNMNIKDIKLILLEEYPCNNIKEVFEREAYWVSQYGTLNNNIPNRTEKQYYMDNATKKKEVAKEYRKNNRDVLNDKQRKHYAENKEKILQRNAEWREQNKDKLKEYERNRSIQRKEYKKEYARKYQEENKELIKQRQREAYLRRKAAGYYQVE